MNTIARMVAVFLVVLAVGCAPARPLDDIEISTDIDPAADFSRYRTFAWLDTANVFSPTVDTDPDDDAKMNAMAHETVIGILTKKGYERTDSGKPDLWITMQTAVFERPNLPVADNSRNRERDELLRGRSEAPDREIELDSARETIRYGTVVLRALDGTSKKMAWTGTAGGVSESSGSGRSKLRRALHRMLENFPSR